MRVLRLKEAYPTAKVELWCEDEARLGLKPIVRKVWSPIGRRPLVKVHQRYEWTYLYAFAHPKSGEVHWLILLVVDRAGWHTAKKKLKVSEGIHLEFLPPHSPELQPAERLWPLSNEGVANCHFEEIEELEETLGERCVALSEQPDLIRSYLRYHWWPQAA